MNDYDKIIHYLFTSDLVPKIAHKYKHYLKGDCEDFKQEMYMVILELPHQKVIDLFESNDLIRYVMQILKNQIFNPKSTFSKKYERFIDKRELVSEKDNDDEDYD